MKILLTTIFTISAFITFGQVPQGINYQGVARDANGVINTQAITVKFDLHQGSAGGTVVFSEIHNITTNNLGLFNLVIGSINTSAFSAINWANSPYFIETTLNGAPLGTQQLMSVPYALYAEKAGNSSPTPTININSPNTANMISMGVYSINIPATILNTYTLTQSGNTVTLFENGTTNIGTINLPTSTTYTSGDGISISSGTITNTAPNQTVTLTGIGSTTVTGSYPNFTINTPPASTSTDSQTLSVNNNSLSISNGNTINLPATSIFQGDNISVLQSGLYNYTVSAVTPSLNVIGATLSGIYPNQTLTVPTSSTTTLMGSTNVTVTGTAPNYTISSPSQSLSLTANTLSLTNSPSVVLPTYSLASSSNSITIYQNGTAINTTTIALTATTSISQGTNIIVSGSSPNYTISSPSQSLSLTANTLSLTNSPSVVLPTYSLSSNSNSITIYQNGTAINTTTIALTSTTSISQGINNNIAVSGVAPNYTISANTYSLSFPTYSTSSLTNGVNTSTTTIPSPPISYTNNILSVGSNTALINTLWQENSGVVSPATLANNVTIGTTTNAGGKFEIEHNASLSAPTIHLKQPTGGLNRIKFSNTGITSKYFEIAGGTNANPALEAVTINYFNSANNPPYRTVFQLDGNKRIGINPLEAIKGCLHVMEDNSGNTPTNGIISEGFNKAGQLILSSTLPTGTFPTYTRGALTAGNELGALLFSGSTSATTFGDGAKIYAKSVNAFTGSNTGTDLIFATTPNGTSSNVDRMVIANNGNIGIGTLAPIERLDIMGSIKIKDGTEGNGKVLTSDGSGKGTWMPVPTPTIAMPWTQGAGTVTLTTNTDKVGIGTTSPLSKLQVESNASIATIFAKNSLTTGIAGEFDGGLMAYNSGNLASISAYKSGTGTGNVAIFTNSAATNNLATLYANTNSTSSLVAVAEFLNGGNGSAINATNNSSNVATINVKNTSTIASALAGFFDGGVISKAGTNSSYAFQVQGSAGISDYFNVRNNGNVGIGVTNPGYKLALYDATTTGTNASMYVQNVNGSGPAILAISGNSSEIALELVDGHIKSSQTTAMSNAGITAAISGASSGTFSSNIFEPNSTDVKGGVRLGGNFSVGAGSANTTISLIGTLTAVYINPSDASLMITVPFNKSYTNPPVVIITPTIDMKGGLPSVVSSNNNFIVTFRWINAATYPLNITSPSFNYMVIE